MRVNAGSFVSTLPASLQQVIDAAPLQQLAAGATLFAPDHAAQAVWLVRAGLVRLYSLTADGHEFNHDFAGPGEWVAGRLALAQDRICCPALGLGAAALRPSTVVTLELAQLDHLRHSDPAVAGYLVDQLLHLGAMRLQREAELMHASAEERYRKLLATRRELVEQLPQREIAAWLGITAVALSRIRRRLQLTAPRPPRQR